MRLISRLQQQHTGLCSPQTQFNTVCFAQHWLLPRDFNIFVVIYRMGLLLCTTQQSMVMLDWLKHLSVEDTELTAVTMYVMVYLLISLCHFLCGSSL